MPTKTIRLHVSANNSAVGVLNVKVTPWRVHLDAGDVARWELDANGPANNDIEWFRIEQIDRVKKWPFNVEPPDPSYTGITTTGSGIVTSPPKKPAATDVVSYGLTIGFRDDAGALRIMYIDPDMVIDS
jgi:hypothetical protein